MGERRKLKDVRPGGLGYLNSPPPEPGQRARTWEQAQRAAGRVTTYRGIPLEVQTAVKDLAAALHVPVGELAGALLAFALGEYEAGRLEIEAQEPARKQVTRLGRPAEG